MFHRILLASFSLRRKRGGGDRGSPPRGATAPRRINVTPPRGVPLQTRMEKKRASQKAELARLPADDREAPQPDRIPAANPSASRLKPRLHAADHFHLASVKDLRFRLSGAEGHQPRHQEGRDLRP